MNVIHAFSCNVIFMISVRSSFHSDSHFFVCFDNTSVFFIVFSNIAAGFPATLAHWSFTGHRSWHRIFELSTGIFFIISLNPSSSGSMK